MPSPPPGFIDTGFTVYDVPVDPDDPTCHTNVGRRVYRNDAGDTWPMPQPPPWPADDENEATPDE